MDHEKLRQTLEELHNEIENTDTVDGESRQMLEHLTTDIRGLLDRSGEASHGEYQSLSEMLSHAITHFEVTHPKLTSNMGQVLNILSGSGI